MAQADYGKSVTASPLFRKEIIVKIKGQGIDVDAIMTTEQAKMHVLEVEAAIAQAEVDPPASRRDGRVRT